MTTVGLGTEAWLSLAVGGLMTLAGLIALFAPVRHLGGRGRPWLLVLLFLPQGVLRIASTLAEAAGARGTATVLLAVQTVFLLGVLVAGIVRWRRARREAVRRGPMDGPGGEARLEEEAAHALAATGNRIEAIRRVRELTGLGLKEAKELVERVGAGR